MLEQESKMTNAYKKEKEELEKTLLKENNKLNKLYLLINRNK